MTQGVAYYIIENALGILLFTYLLHNPAFKSFSRRLASISGVVNPIYCTCYLHYVSIEQIHFGFIHYRAQLHLIKLQ